MRNWLSKKEHRTYGYNKPNTKALARGVVSPGRLSMNKNTALQDIYIMIDNSGSISDVEIGRIFSQVESIIKNMRNNDIRIVVGYWTDAIDNIGEFTDMKGFIKIATGNQGGTNVRAVFEFLNGERSFKDSKGKLWEARPTKIKGVIIFTDGEIYRDYGQYEKAFKNKTLWVIDGGIASPNTSNLLFGKVASSHPEND